MESYVEQISKPYDDANRIKAFDDFANFIKPLGDTKSVVEYKITPALAACLLTTFNGNNRHISSNSVDKMVADIRHGRFQPDNGQTIVLAKDFSVNDGQHRLCAVIRSATPITFWIAINRDRDSRFTLDTGTKRTTGHMLSLMGFNYGNTIAAAARRIEAYRLAGNPTASSRISDSQTMNFATSDELLNEVAQWAHTHQAAFRPMRLAASEVTTLFYLFSEKEPKEARMFFETLRDGLGLSKDSPIHLLRQKLLTSPRLSPGMRFELVIKAWNAWIRNDTISRIHVMGKIPTILGKKDMTKSHPKAKTDA